MVFFRFMKQKLLIQNPNTAEKQSSWGREHGAKRPVPYSGFSQQSSKAVPESNSKLTKHIFCWRQANAVVVQRRFCLDWCSTNVYFKKKKSLEEDCGDKLIRKTEISYSSVKPTDSLTILHWF